MPKTKNATKTRTRTKKLTSKKKTVSAAEMKKVKGGATFGTLTTGEVDVSQGLLLPAVQKVRTN